jgi:hypothetical protein
MMEDQMSASNWVLAIAMGIILPATAANAQYDVDIRNDIVFAEHDGVKLLGDLYSPKGLDKAPVLVAVHGGGWQVGNRKFYVNWGPYLAENGYAVFAIRLCLRYFVTIDRSQIKNNTGGGIKIDASGGGPITATIADSFISLNGSNGVNALSGPLDNVLVNLTNDIIATNGLAGVQSNQTAGGSAVITISRSTLSNNGSAWGSVGGGTLLSFQNNEVTGATGSTPSPASFQ